MFLVLEGPNGVGKTSVAEAVAQQLNTRLPSGTPLIITKEPSASPLGDAVRSMEAELRGRALGLACAADRLHHVEHAILPILTDGGWVVCDRYVPSSLVLQRLDGMELEDIWSINATAPTPDLTFYLEDDAATIAARLAAREDISRLEETAPAGRELELYRDAREFLEGHGWRQHVVVADGRGPYAIAGELVRVALA